MCSADWLLVFDSFYCSRPHIVWLTAALPLPDSGPWCGRLSQLFSALQWFSPCSCIFLLQISSNSVYLLLLTKDFFFYFLVVCSDCGTVSLRRSALLRKAPRGHVFHHLHCCIPFPADFLCKTSVFHCSPFSSTLLAECRFNHLWIRNDEFIKRLLVLVRLVNMTSDEEKFTGHKMDAPAAKVKNQTIVKTRSKSQLEFQQFVWCE